MLSEMTRDWPKSVHHGLCFLKLECRAKERWKKSGVLSDNLNYNMLQDYYRIFLPSDTKNKLPLDML